jgi:hypothetical protein
MGGGVSTLNPVNAAKITHALRERYHECKLNPEWTDADIQDNLTTEYTRLIHHLLEEQISCEFFEKQDKSVNISSTYAAKQSHGIEASESHLLKKSASGKFASMGTRSKLSRRRSFDKSFLKHVTPPKKVKSPSKDEVPIQSITSNHDTPDEPTIDVWDSVTEQPYCKVCSMAFKSVAFLDRHVKYSVLHAKSVGAASIPFEKPYEEGTDYKLIYSGCKFFWRTREEVELFMYLHVDSQAIEVIAFDLLNSSLRELPRIYLSHPIIVSLAEASFLSQVAIMKERHAIEKMVKLNEASDQSMLERKSEDARDDDDKVDAPVFDAFKEVATFIIQRLQFQASADILNRLSSSLVSKAVVFSSHPSDGDRVLAAVLPLPPIQLRPVRVVRRRRTNGQEEVLAQQDLVNKDLEAIAYNTSMAEKYQSQSQL